jgi:hypothetical protein
VTGAQQLLPIAELTNAAALAWGPDGLLYVLELLGPGNSRVRGFTDTGVVQKPFALSAGVAVDPREFEVGANGRFYLGDGAGGGAVYSTTGGFLGAFTRAVPRRVLARTPWPSIRMVR